MKDNKLNEEQKIKKDYGRAGKEILNIINKNKKDNKFKDKDDYDR